MTQKERLVELLKGCPANYAFMYDGDFDLFESLADHLLSHGVIVPPCKVGDVVYERIIDYHGAGYIRQYLVEEILLENDNRVHVAVCDVNNAEDSFMEDEIGEKWFLSYEEAKQALKEMEK